MSGQFLLGGEAVYAVNECAIHCQCRAQVCDPGGGLCAAWIVLAAWVVACTGRERERRKQQLSAREERHGWNRRQL